ncbi:MAG TPA: hypothetical protein VHQ45_01240 [Gemmatimonadaceae bacterium]|jgi:hypothetical protein|nr:hypothetical protein [Gemmatimonadaceae bacterium]
MTQPQAVLVPGAAPTRAARATSPATVAEGPNVGRRVLAALGLTFLVVGLTDLALAWYPLVLGNPEWEFGTVSATINGLPVPTLGLALLGVAAAQSERRWHARLVGVLANLFLLALLGCAMLYALTVPVALQSVQEPMVRVGLVKGMVKAGVASTAYIVFFGWLAWRLLRPAPSR